MVTIEELKKTKGMLRFHGHRGFRIDSPSRPPISGIQDIGAPFPYEPASASLVEGRPVLPGAARLRNPTAGISMAGLTSKQRAHLRSLAHHLKPIIQVGAEGVSDPLIKTVGEAFNTRELLKVKVLEGAPEDARTTADAMVAAMEGVEVAQTIGRTVVLYRPFPEDPEIRLPD